MRHAGLMVATQLGDGIGCTVRVAHDLADPIRSHGHRALLQRRWNAVTPPARDIWTITAPFHHDINFGCDPPAAGTAGTARLAIERAADDPDGVPLCTSM